MLVTVRELEETLKIIKQYEYEMIKRDKISQLLKTRVAEVVRTKKRAARKRAKILQRRVLLAQEMAILTGTAPAPIDPNIQLEFEYIMQYLKFNKPIIDDLFQSLSEEELKIIRPYLQ
ncbi:hypothetical protein QTP88_006211 [Uroleucon formosanum]